MNYWSNQSCAIQICSSVPDQFWHRQLHTGGVSPVANVVDNCWILRCHLIDFEQ